MALNVENSMTIDPVNLPPINPGKILSEALDEIDVSVSALARALDVPQRRSAHDVWLLKTARHHLKSW